MEPERLGAKEDSDLESIDVALETLDERTVLKPEEVQEEAADLRLVAEKVAEMEILTPEVLRATPAHRAFQGFARALRKNAQGKFYQRSFLTKRISSFWSHSWHGDHWKKILTLLMIYNGFASVVIGCLVACCMMILFSFGLLPGFTRNTHVEVFSSAWSVGCFFVATVITFLFWRAQRLVFVDRICISQDDDTLKTMSIVSLAGILRLSQEMLVLWDESWSERLWCQFELAPFWRVSSKKVNVLLWSDLPSWDQAPLWVSLVFSSSAYLWRLRRLMGQREGLGPSPWWHVSWWCSAAFRSWWPYASTSEE